MRLHWLLVLMCLTVTACGGSSARPLTAPYRSTDKVFFVENHGKDSRGMEAVIARAIASKGYTVTSGPKGQRPAAFDLLVTYEDHWSWDMRMYLSKIEIWVRDARTGTVIAEAESHQGSMSAAGDKYEEIVARVAASLFGTK